MELQYLRTKENIVAAINSSGLHPIVVEAILKDVLEEVQQLKNQALIKAQKLQNETRQEDVDNG